MASNPVSKSTLASLQMKPYEVHRMFADRFSTVEDLSIALAKAAMISGQNASEINVEFGHEERIVSQLALEAECLSDGSIVYNVILTA